MKTQIALFLFFMTSLSLLSQERLAKGYVLDKDSHAAINGAELWVEGEKEKAITNKRGEFVINVPQGRPYLLIKKTEYLDSRFKLQPGFQHRPSRIYLELAKSADILEKKQNKIDSLFMTYKNAVSLSLIELLAVGIGLRYERFLLAKHSIGLHMTYYIYGINSAASTDIGGDEPPTKYHGVKVAAFYRFYVLKKNTRGLFLDAKIPFGYFDFYELTYRYKDFYHLDITRSTTFWTWGTGISVGYLGRLPRTKHGLINISVGYQYFPMADVPKTVSREVSMGTEIDLEIDTSWWDQMGPGASIEVKLTIGGIF